MVRFGIGDGAAVVLELELAAAALDPLAPLAAAVAAALAPLAPLAATGGAAQPILSNAQ